MFINLDSTTGDLIIELVIRYYSNKLSKFTFALFVWVGWLFSHDKK